MTTKLRPYQIDAVTEIRAHAAAGGLGAIVQLATGAGKTAVFCDLLKAAHQKNRAAIMVVRGKALVQQASERLSREGVPHGIFQGDNTRETHHRILVCSVDTLYARRLAPKAELVVIDECHLSLSEGYEWLLAQYPKAFKLGVSATPHHKRGMRHIGNVVVRPTDINKLIAGGYLVGGRYFVPYVPDLRGVKKSQGDFNASDLGKRSRDDKELTANAARVWSAHLRGKSTLCYAVNVGHAEILATGLREAGARVEIITANTKDGLRRDYIGGLSDGRLDVLVSVGVLTTGVDIPSLRAILCCRPTESYNLWIQILGRGTRPFPGKDSFLCYDLAGNVFKHGPIESELPCDLDGFPAPAKISVKTCPACFATFEVGPTECPACGASLAETKARTTGKRVHGLTDNDEIIEVKVEQWELDLPALVEKAKLHGHRKGAVYHLLKARYGDEIANKAWPRIRAMKRWPVKDMSQAQDLETMPA